MHRFGRDRLDRATVAVVTGELDDEHVDPPVDHICDGCFARKETLQELFNRQPRRLNHCGGQLLLAAGKVVIERPRFDAGVVKDLVQAGGRVALAAEQSRCGLYQRGSAAIGAGHS